MWKRFVRWMRSIFGGAVDSLENPEKILQQNIRDMNDQIPVMNENIAMVKANVNLTQNSLEKLRAKEKDLRAKIKSALLAGRRDMALNYATTLEQAQGDMAGAEGNLELAKKSLEKALKVKEAFMAERDRKIKEAMRAITLARQAEWQSKVADAMDSFEVAGVDQTHQDMVGKIEEKVAKAQARLELALGNVNADDFQMEKESAKLQANETLRQFEIELGLVSPEPVAAAKTLGPAEDIAARADAEIPAPSAKTMGKEKA